MSGGMDRDPMEERAELPVTLSAAIKKTINETPVLREAVAAQLSALRLSRSSANNHINSLEQDIVSKRESVSKLKQTLAETDAKILTLQDVLNG